MGNDFDKKLNEKIEKAVGVAFDNWAQEHPSLAAVMDRIEICERTAISLRKSDECRQAMKNYQQAAVESDILSRLTGLAETIIPLVL